ncbi:MAG: hypothetical protein P8X88_06695 [Gammaproteobacteria bacterium]
MIKSRKYYGIYLLLFLQYLIGCSGLLPKDESITVGSWGTFEEAQQTFDKIIPHQTSMDELKELNISPETNANISILNYSDVTSRFIAGLAIEGYVLDSGIRECIMAKTNCKGYEINVKVIQRKRYGNFWADLLNFKRKTDIVGWNFNGIVLINDGLVVYKLSSGQPSIHEKVEKKNPLGPLQSGGIATDILKQEL